MGKNVDGLVMAGAWTYTVQNIQHNQIVKTVMDKLTMQSQNVIGVHFTLLDVQITIIVVQVAWLHLHRIKIATV